MEDAGAVGAIGSPDRLDLGTDAGPGTLQAGLVQHQLTCPWHGSTFRFADGSIVRGPASTPEPRYQTRIQDGHIEVRALT